MIQFNKNTFGLNNLCQLVLAVSAAYLACACSSSPLSPKTDKDIAASGPTVIDAKTDPETIELTRDLNTKSAEVIANVQDFGSNVKSVKLSFIHVPLEIPMTRVVGNTWHAVLNEKQLQKLAIGGSTARYEANVTALDKNGKMSAVPKPVTISIKAPSFSSNG